MEESSDDQMQNWASVDIDLFVEAGKNPTKYIYNVAIHDLKDLYISPELIEDMRNWLPGEDDTKEVFKDCGLYTSLDGINGLKEIFPCLFGIEEIGEITTYIVEDGLKSCVCDIIVLMRTGCTCGGK